MNNLIIKFNNEYMFYVFFCFFIVYFLIFITIIIIKRMKKKVFLKLLFNIRLGNKNDKIS